MPSSYPVDVSFDLFIRCSNCLRDSARTLSFSNGPCTPTDVDELMESGCLNQVAYECEQCGSVIGQITGINRRRDLDDLECDVVDDASDEADDFYALSGVG